MLTKSFLFLAVLTGKLNFKNVKILPLSFSKGVTPTPTPTIYLTPTPRTIFSNTGSNKNGITQIPATGAPIELLPILFSGLFGGIYLSKKK